MTPLYLRFSTCKSTINRLCAGLLGLGLFCALSSPFAAAQDKQDPAQAARTTQADPNQVAPPTPMIKFRERPRYVTDPQRLRRTPTIDGVVNDGEWDPFYTIDDAPIKGTIYCNWDDNFLYLAAKTDAPATVIFDIDAAGDGWLRGSDNIEIVVSPATVAGGPPTLMARLLDAANSKDTPVWNEAAIDPKTIGVAMKSMNGGQALELAIPKNTGSLVLRPGASIGLRGEFIPPIPASSYVPTQPFEPHLLLDANLVEARVVAASGINPKLTLSDYKCIPGQKLFATLELYNQTDIPVKIKSVLWTGQGNSVNAVNTFRDVNVPAVMGMRRDKLKYETILPEGLALGSYTLNVIVETDQGKQVQSAASFTVVEPVQVQINLEPQPVAVVGPTRLDVNVDVMSAVPNHFRGDVELTVIPSGWEYVNGKKHGLLIDREDAHEASRFTVRMPSNTPAGTYPIEATVTWHGKVWKARAVANVIRTDAPVKPSGGPAPSSTP